jgi:flavorubredoxin
MRAIELADGVYWVGTNLQTEDLFEGIWPIPLGVSPNSHLVRGDKVAIIDLVREFNR